VHEAIHILEEKTKYGDYEKKFERIWERVKKDSILLRNIDGNIPKNTPREKLSSERMANLIEQTSGGGIKWFQIPPALKKYTDKYIKPEKEDKPRSFFNSIFNKKNNMSKLLDRIQPDVASAVNIVGSSRAPRLDSKKNKLEALKVDQNLSRLMGSIESNQMTDELQQNKLAATELLGELEQLNIKV